MNEPDLTEPPKIGWRKIILPVGFGLAISLYLIFSNFDLAALKTVPLSAHFFTGMLLALLSVIIRDAAFMYKVRLSSGEKMSWGQAFRAIVMWEFGAAVTPKLGEVAFTMYVLKKSGLSYGRSTAVFLLNSFLDNLAFVVVFALLYLSLGSKILMVSTSCPDLAGQGVMKKLMVELGHLADKAWIGYVIFCAIAAFFGVALFILPHRAKSFFYYLSGTKLLRRFSGSLQHLGDEIEITANEYKNHKAAFWLKMGASTLINWSARYLLVNALLFAFSAPNANVLDVYARQYVLWIFLVIPTTPGASGWAEISFIALNCEFLPLGLSAAITLIWRIFSYYIYLVAGIIVLPAWLRGESKKS